jgi:hypothetical protein
MGGKKMTTGSIMNYSNNVRFHYEFLVKNRFKMKKEEFSKQLLVLINFVADSIKEKINPGGSIKKPITVINKSSVSVKTLSTKTGNVNLKKNKDKVIQYPEKFVEKYALSTFDKSVNNICEKNIGTYEKTMAIYRFCKEFPGWHKLSVIPEKFQIDFIH